LAAQAFVLSLEALDLRYQRKELGFSERIPRLRPVTAKQLRFDSLELRVVHVAILFSASPSGCR
jgi:hypothetical protein